jgi:hypothetical protein
MKRKLGRNLIPKLCQPAPRAPEFDLTATRARVGMTIKFAEGDDECSTFMEWEKNKQSHHMIGHSLFCQYVQFKVATMCC